MYKVSGTIQVFRNHILFHVVISSRCLGRDYTIKNDRRKSKFLDEEEITVLLPATEQLQKNSSLSMIK
jgi:hypothetical protein